MMKTICGNQIPDGTFALIMIEANEVKRDDDLLRKLLLEIEAQQDAVYVLALHLSSSPEERRAYYHLKLLADAGFLDETGSGSGGVFRITNAGHDFLASIRDETAWSKVKGASRSLGDVGLGFMKDIGIGYLRAKAVEMGIPLA